MFGRMEASCYGIIQGRGKFQSYLWLGAMIPGKELRKCLAEDNYGQELSRAQGESTEVKKTLETKS